MKARHVPAVGCWVDREDTAEADGRTGEAVRPSTSRRRPSAAAVRDVARPGPCQLVHPIHKESELR